MKEIWSRDKTLTLFVLPQQLRSDATYRWSQYVLHVEMEERRFLFNTLTKQCFEIEFPFDQSARFTADAIQSDADLKELTEARFLVPEDKDECEYYESILKLLRAFTQKREFDSYTILPTTACNARCVYCYEEDYKKARMTDEIVAKTIDFILRTRAKERTIHLGWFGGEPLLGEAIIDRICAALTENDVKFHASMITNGSLLTREMIEKACKDWKLTRVQVSMDGCERDYVPRKNYRVYRGEYRKVLENVNLLAEQDLPVTIRCNADFDNFSGLNEFLDDLENAVTTNKKRVSICFNPLFDVQSSPRSAEMWQKCLEIQKTTAKRGFPPRSVTDLHSLKITYCMAENPYSSVVITPDGLFHNCEHCVPGTEIGDLDRGLADTERLDTFLSSEPVRDKCRKCLYLPVCTSFTRCPVKYDVECCQEVWKTTILYDFALELSRSRDKPTAVSTEESTAVSTEEPTEKRHDC